MWLRNILNHFRLIRRKRAIANRYKHDITKHFKDLKNRRYLTKEQKKEIQAFYKPLIGRKVSFYCHEYFYSRTGVFSKEYIPTDLYNVELLTRANRLDLNLVYRDKNLTDVFLQGVKQPHTILKRMNGYYYFEGNAVSEEDAINYCSNLDDVLIKPSLLQQGEGIQSLTVTDGRTNINDYSLKQLFHIYGDNFQIQEKLKQHERMRALNPTSVNTIRIVTYRSDMEVLLIYAVVRIGKPGAVIDNQCAGGISAIIDENGRLGKYGFGGYDVDNILQTDSGIVLEGYQIPSYDKAVDTVKRLHLQLPFYDIIGWDIAIDESGDPALIEWNTKVGLSQSAFGPGFGKYTERIIKELWKKKPHYV
ncbi:MAG: hypothetical protein J1F05_04240 [Muribaculaceae bacterium]|nr:hypothetical protein [Muribaculaceae bacterium]